jgi:hypothetical protein
MAAAIRGGVLYFALVFAIGFAFGVVRQTLVIPRIGERAAVLLEVPLLLALAWPLCRRVVRRCAVPPALPHHVVMGLVAFALLMLAELLLAVTLAGQTPAQHWARYAELPVQIGLAGQILFALFPVLQR